MTATSRFSNPVALIPALADITAAVNKVNADGTLPQTTVDLLQLRVGQILGSAYFTVRVLRQSEDTAERLGAVATWREAPCFTEAERAALALAEAVHTPNPSGDRVSDEVYAEAAKHYDERELVTLTSVLGQMGFYIPLALIGQPIPGVAPAEQWQN
ncbi:carboxymuconolactone decarboxylase family protein [Stackebrandtia nassauensis]|uniref:Carboxymuconolactone decarboxylase n=1 Tax=Stackebrandtia nassauensis (strain DSM 44728 / CIP 108903 / NRRL B-16338 / NBRC 102104 / LLR-40K-21) TaxID=446470 RepID=D3Q7B5_STANL|nr:carboxymuconolactone decarboxylase family protein [Stackebrandtia nassauensis]ADD42386.1 Carboxymuconolactone decarboxylase [Stackebrandtia nassauensis DSM 44728]